MTPANCKSALARAKRPRPSEFSASRLPSRELTTQVGQGVQENKLERGIAIVENDRRAMAGVNLQASRAAES